MNEPTWEDEIMAAQIWEALSEVAGPDPSAWCQERECISFYMDMATGKAYPCPHRPGRPR